MIRKFQTTDIHEVMKIWLESNQDAHDFISEEYWKSNYAMVEEQLFDADLYISETNGKIQGFAGLVGNYIAGIFIDKKYRSMGIGKELLDDIKKEYSSLSLSVYEKNKRAADFYIREGFCLDSEGIDEDTNEKEYTMIWKKNQESEVEAVESK